MWLNSYQSHINFTGGVSDPTHRLFFLAAMTKYVAVLLLFDFAVVEQSRVEDHEDGAGVVDKGTGHRI